MPNLDFESYPDTQYTFEKIYVTDEGREQATPVGPPGTPSEIVRWSAPSCKLFIPWTAQRLGKPPVLPHWDLGDPHATLIKKTIVPAVPMLQPDRRSYLFSVSGQYEYALDLPPEEGDGIPMGLPPSDPSGKKTTLRSTDFKRGVFGRAIG